MLLICSGESMRTYMGSATWPSLKEKHDEIMVVGGAIPYMNAKQLPFKMVYFADAESTRYLPACRRVTRYILSLWWAIKNPKLVYEMSRNNAITIEIDVQNRHGYRGGGAWALRWALANYPEAHLIGYDCTPEPYRMFRPTLVRLREENEGRIFELPGNLAEVFPCSSLAAEIPQ